MHSTKSLILAFIKRNSGSTVDELAQELRIASVTVRQHLTTLQRDDLLEAEPVRRATGRPHYIYRLTRHGEDTFPRHYDRLAKALLQEVSRLEASDLEGLGPHEKTALLLRRLADRLAGEYAPQVRGRPLKERVAAVTEILRADGGFAEWEKTERGFAILDYNCFFGGVPKQNGHGCQWHFYFLSKMVGPRVRVEAAQGCGDCCRYVIEA